MTIVPDLDIIAKGGITFPKLTEVSTRKIMQYFRKLHTTVVWELFKFYPSKQTTSPLKAFPKKT